MYSGGHHHVENGGAATFGIVVVDAVVDVTAWTVGVAVGVIAAAFSFVVGVL